MSIYELLRWQWQGYPRYHRSRSNLLIHIVVVPLFLLGNVVVLAALVERTWGVAAAAIVGMVLSVALQGRGHKQEPVPPEPFTGPGNAMLRIFCEQWVTFPRFVLSGGWWTGLHNASVP